MSDMEVVPLKIFGRDISLSCPADEKEDLLMAAELLKSELDGIENKSNALVLAGLSLANKFLKNENKSEISSEDESKISELIKNIENIIEN